MATRTFAAPAFLSPRSSATSCAADFDVDAEAYRPASPDLVVSESIAPSGDATFVKLAALTLVSLATPQRLAPRLSTQKQKLDPDQLLRPRLALETASIGLVHSRPAVPRRLGYALKSCCFDSPQPCSALRRSFWRRSRSWTLSNSCGHVSHLNR